MVTVEVVVAPETGELGTHSKYMGHVMYMFSVVGTFYNGRHQVRGERQSPPQKRFGSIHRRVVMVSKGSVIMTRRRSVRTTPYFNLFLKVFIGPSV